MDDGLDPSSIVRCSPQDLGLREKCKPYRVPDFRERTARRAIRVVWILVETMGLVAAVVHNTRVALGVQRHRRREGVPQASVARYRPRYRIFRVELTTGFNR